MSAQICLLSLQSTRVARLSPRRCVVHARYAIACSKSTEVSQFVLPVARISVIVAGHGTLDFMSVLLWTFICIHDRGGGGRGGRGGVSFLETEPCDLCWPPSAVRRFDVTCYFLFLLFNQMKLLTACPVGWCRTALILPDDWTCMQPSSSERAGYIRCADLFFCYFNSPLDTIIISGWKLDLLPIA